MESRYFIVEIQPLTVIIKTVKYYRFYKDTIILYEWMLIIHQYVFIFHA